VGSQSSKSIDAIGPAPSIAAAPNADVGSCRCAMYRDERGASGALPAWKYAVRESGDRRKPPADGYNVAVARPGTSTGGENGMSRSHGGAVAVAGTSASSASSGTATSPTPSASDLKGVQAVPATTHAMAIQKDMRKQGPVAQRF